MKDINSKLLGLLALVAIMFAVLLFWLWDDRLEKLKNDLQLISEGNQPTDFIGKYDYVCFTLSDQPQNELIAESARIGFAGYPAKCALYDSSIVIVGLVKNNQIECVENIGFSYWIQEKGPRCFQPSKLRVLKLTSAPLSEDIASRRTFSPKVPTFQIMEKQ